MNKPPMAGGYHIEQHKTILLPQKVPLFLCPHSHNTHLAVGGICICSDTGLDSRVQSKLLAGMHKSSAELALPLPTCPHPPAWGHLRPTHSALEDLPWSSTFLLVLLHPPHTCFQNKAGRNLVSSTGPACPVLRPLPF